jgi:hypothetical protein
VAEDIFVRYSQSEKERQDLERLVDQVRYISIISSNTGLRILEVFSFQDELCVLMYLGSFQNISELRKELLCFMAREKIIQILSTE